MWMVWKGWCGVGRGRGGLGEILAFAAEFVCFDEDHC